MCSMPKTKEQQDNKAPKWLTHPPLHACMHICMQVANNKKQLLEGDYPLVLSLPDDDYSSGTNLSLLEASVGPELHWTLSSINHVLRTA